ncbi:MAG: universal stress protein [Myxococcales bacterium]|nr:universal stress protein [Myxococcales bacterium]
MKRILVALDGSERAAQVLAAAQRLASLASATLVLYRAISLPPILPIELLAATDRGLEDILRSNAHEAIGRLASGLPAGMIETIITDFSIAWDGIVRAGRARDADLIVIGSHGFGGIDHILGTTAAKVVNHADRNVLVVRTLL